MIVAVDGFSGTGKSTVALMLAQKLDFSYLNTGATYRCVGIYFLDNNIDPDTFTKPGDILSTLDKIKIQISGGFDLSRYYLGDVDVTDRLFDGEVSFMSSKVAQIPEVRRFLHEFQRNFVGNCDFVAEGRDVGLKVFPDAEYKFFITASPEEKARRRHKQLTAMGQDVQYENILAELQERDKRDYANTQLAPGTITVDTDGINPGEVVSVIIKHMTILDLA